MTITYLNHSGFLLEWEQCYWLFDYCKGDLPDLNPQKELFIFCSHSHGDHFHPEIFSLYSKHTAVNYLFSNELRNTCKKWEKNNPGNLPPVHFLKSRTDTVISTSSGENLYIHTLQSTDCGCAFFITYKEKTVYHAGDLHWWYWEGEDPSWNKKMTADYKKEMEYLKDKTIDLAFTPLDPRQGKDYALGMNYLLKNSFIKHIFPMHFWDDFAIIKQYLQEFKLPENTTFHSLQQDGQTIEIML